MRELPVVPALQSAKVAEGYQTEAIMRSVPGDLGGDALSLESRNVRLPSARIKTPVIESWSVGD